MNTPAELDIARRLDQDILAPMKKRFVGKDEIVDLLGVALVSGENLFLLGPPGTAKSALVHELASRLDGRSFEYLLTRFTEPNELFGPFDIRRLREGELVTNTANMLPEAELAFLDELLNANSAILNSLLTVLNERILRRGRETFDLPLLTVIGASNRLPEDETLGALFDRFLIRVRCDNVERDRLSEVLDAGWSLETEGHETPITVTTEEVRTLSNIIAQVEIASIRDAIATLVAQLRQAGLAVSDRRAVKFQRLIAASALLCGRMEARRSDLWVLRYTWDTEEQEQVLASLVRHAIDEGEANQPDDHPRSRDSEQPDPETIARDLDALDAAVDASPSGAERVRLIDRLSTLTARCEWIENDTSRSELLARTATLWERLGR